MLKRLLIMLVLGCLCLGSVIVSAEEKEAKIAVVEWTAQIKSRHKWYVVPFIKRLKNLGILADCLSANELFIEKKVYEYDAVVVIPWFLTIDEFDELKTYVEKGGIFIPISTGAHVIDIDENGKVNVPPDIYVVGKGGIFYELTGGMRRGGTGNLVTSFEVLKSCPITEGLKVGEIIEANVNGTKIISDEDVDVCCGNAVLGKSKKIRTKCSVIQIKRTGKGASIYITASLHKSKNEKVNILSKNIFSRKTFKWVLGEDVR